ncbi:MAG TPA: hypothetical protein VME18_04995 [Acidobacteriaceae bacterium]|nr:hypothetical protein [Acidobacteriaceae bacterium]
MTASRVEGRPGRWRRRPACMLVNDVVELTHLTGGGQILDFHFHDAAEMNPFWIPHWKLRDPMRFRPGRDEAIYGPRATGRVLSAIAGHSLCLGIFGMPSEQEILAGSVLHGEAGVQRWNAEATSGAESGELRFTLPLPASGLEFSRTVSLRAGESVIRISETVRNRLDVDQFLQWQQHVALAPPFASGEACVLTLPGQRGLTDPGGYEGHELLVRAAEFDWPLAPGAGGEAIDLRVPFQKPGAGFVAGVQVDPGRERGFVCAANAARNLAFGYVFPRSRFPWVTLWEENRSRASAPWEGREQVRALEFGVSALPLGRAETIRRGDIFGTPTMALVPARGEVGATYLVFLARLPAEAPCVADIECGENELRLLALTGNAISVLPASRVQEFLGRKGDERSEF